MLLILFFLSTVSLVLTFKLLDPLLKSPLNLLYFLLVLLLKLIFLDIFFEPINQKILQLVKDLLLDIFELLVQLLLVDKLLDFVIESNPLNKSMSYQVFVVPHFLQKLFIKPMILQKLPDPSSLLHNFPEKPINVDLSVYVHLTLLAQERASLLFTH